MGKGRSRLIPKDEMFGVIHVVRYSLGARDPYARTVKFDTLEATDASTREQPSGKRMTSFQES